MSENKNLSEIKMSESDFVWNQIICQIYSEIKLFKSDFV